MAKELDENESLFVGEMVYLTKNGDEYPYVGTILGIYTDPVTEHQFYCFEYEGGQTSFIHVDTPTEIAPYQKKPDLKIAPVLPIKKK